MQLTYYEEPGPEWAWWRPARETPEDDIHTIKWGYNLADLDRLSHVAARRAFGGYGTHADRFEAAHSGVITALLAAPERPAPEDLIHAGWQSLHEWAQTEARQHGRDHTTGAPRPQFDLYWSWAASTTGSPERVVVERLALWQIWPTLTPGDRRALLALAATGDYTRTAAELGIAEKLLSTQLARARRRFLALWHEHEPPSRAPWRRDRRVCRRDGLDSHGRARITESQLEQIRARHHVGEPLAAIAADYGSTKATLSALLTGRSRPAPDLVGAS